MVQIKSLIGSFFKAFLKGLFYGKDKQEMASTAVYVENNNYIYSDRDDEKQYNPYNSTPFKGTPYVGKPLRGLAFNGSPLTRKSGRRF